METLYKYSGAGNDFIILDGRIQDVSAYLDSAKISSLCDRTLGFKAADGRIGADGLMVLYGSAEADFRMKFFNPDGSHGMMCGNGGRCITAFADYLGIKPASSKAYLFEAPDGMHSAWIVGRDGNVCTVRLKMKFPSSPVGYPDGWFVDTGTRHFVKFVPDVESVDVAVEGRAIRRRPEFLPEGVNADFVQVLGDKVLKVRTFEKGVEAETLACGTGVVASAYVYCLRISSAMPVTVLVHTRQDVLSVDISEESVFLTGPAELIV